MTDVHGRVAFITGGANGIGLGMAKSFARAGARLALIDLDTDALARAKAELGRITDVETFRLDVRDRDAYAAVAEAAEQALGPVSLLCNNAGVAPDVPAGKATYDHWDWSLGINLYGVINGIQTFLAKMVERGGGGHVVSTASGAGLVPSSGALYCTAKYGVVALSESLGVELAPTGIGVTVLCPGPVATGIVDRTAQDLPGRGAELTEAQARRVAERQAQMTALLQNGASPDDVGEMVLNAVRENRLYVHTDRFVEAMIAARTDALLAAVPGATAIQQESDI